MALSANLSRPGSLVHRLAAELGQRLHHVREAHRVLDAAALPHEARALAPAAVAELADGRARGGGVAGRPEAEAALVPRRHEDQLALDPVRAQRLVVVPAGAEVGVRVLVWLSSCMVMLMFAALLMKATDASSSWLISAKSMASRPYQVALNVSNCCR